MDYNNSFEDAQTPPMTSLTNQVDGAGIAQIIFLVIVCLVGTVGNVMTIIAVKIERTLRESLSNLFIINLAVADLFVCSTVVPMMIYHVVVSDFGRMLCYVTVTISGIACHTAAATMTCIALTRYAAAYHTIDYHQIVTRKRVYLSIGFVWLFAVLNTAPILVAWIEVDYDAAKYVCVCFDGAFPLYYTLGPVFIGHFLPHAVTAYCYVKIMMAIKRSRQRFPTSTAANDTTASTELKSGIRTKGGEREMMSESGDEIQREKPSKSGVIGNMSKHDIQLLRTSIWIIGFFSLCWIPYGILVLLQDLSPIELKRTFASLCLFSFSFNPIIYGFLSKSFRRAYYRMVKKMLCKRCKREERYSSSSGRSPCKTQNTNLQDLDTMSPPNSGDMMR